jgi:ribosomal protein S9
MQQKQMLFFAIQAFDSISVKNQYDIVVNVMGGGL